MVLAVGVELCLLAPRANRIIAVSPSASQFSYVYLFLLFSRRSVSFLFFAPRVGLKKLENDSDHRNLRPICSIPKLQQQQQAVLTLRPWCAADAAGAGGAVAGGDT